MKTAISIPDEIFISAEAAIQRLGVPRSRFYTQALKDYLKKQHNDEVTKKLNEVYSREDSSLHPTLQKLQSRSLAKDRW